MVLSSAAQNEECPVGTSKFSGQSAVCVSLLDFCLGQSRVVKDDWCGERCVAPKIPDPNGEACRDDSEILRPVLMMTELKEMMETQLYNLQDSDIVLTTYFRYLTGQVKKRVEKIEKALYETQSGNIKIRTVLRNIKNLYNDFLYKIKEINDEIKAKQDSVTAALTKVAVFNEMLAGVKQNKRNLYKSQLVKDLFSKIKTTFVQVD